ncbi:MAG: enoyl-CoA hydratase [Paraglaciecola psychrophila]|jgi:enoyl-CoA hydratase
MEYQLKDNTALISIDDGKANAMNHSFIDSLGECLDRAEKEASAVILQGREGMFSAGFDLKELAKGEDEATQLVNRGMAMITRLYALPLPLISVCAGHAFGMGAFILLASDNRLGSNTDYKVNLPETAIGMSFNPVLMSLIKAHVTPRHQTMAALQSRKFTPAESITAGFLDQLMDTDQLLTEAFSLAKELSNLPAAQYGTNKQFLREAPLKVMRDALN